MLFTIYGEYVRHYGGEIWVGSLTRMLGEFGLSEQAVRVAISRMVSQGWLVAHKAGNRSFYSMTPRGKKRLDEAGERIYKETAPSQWNGKWCIATYNIPEKQRQLRDQFRKDLMWMGFGMLANSVWISPIDLSESVKDVTRTYKMEEFVEVFTAEHLGFADHKHLVEKCWNLNEINQSFEAFIQQWRPQYEQFLQNVERNEPIADSFCFVEKTKLVHEYRKFLFIDPGLPAELLPDYWMGAEADVLFREYYALLDPGAIRYFLSVFETAPKLTK